MFSAQNLPPNRNFGFLSAGVFALLAAYGAYHDTESVKVYGWLIAGAVVGLIAVTAPNLLTPFNKAWMKLGDLMGQVVSPLILGIIFFVLITPVAIISKLFGLLNFIIILFSDGYARFYPLKWHEN